MSKMFSQWLKKRICKFFVKRMLGRLLRSEVDLDQLDVQLGLGTLVLRDLHLNTEYLNDQLGYAAVAIKEGEVGCVKAKIPWRVLTDDSCVIELENLKLVVVPRPSSHSTGKNTCAASPTENMKFVDSQDYLSGDADGYGLGVGGGGAYMGVDDGVRMIAQMVERILLNLRVKVTDLVIVFEEQLVESGDAASVREHGVCESSYHSSPFHSVLLVRVPRLEYGVETAVPDIDDTAKGITEVEPNMLVKVVKFEGATVEVAGVLKVGLVSQDVTENSPGLSSSQPSFPRKPVKILDGDFDGIFGTIQLSVPWKDGTLDVPKFHGDIVISSMNLKVSPHEIRQLSTLLRAFTSVGGIGSETGSCVPASAQNAVNFGDIPRSYVAESTDNSRDVYRSISESFSTARGRVSEAAPPNNSFLPVSKFISNWIYSGGSEFQGKEVDLDDADLAASIDEFFECFDGTRSMQQSQASGLWNWPRSAFSAITAASSLATGASVIPPDADKRRKVEYSIKAGLAGVSVHLYYDFLRPEETSDSSNASILEGAAEEHLNAELSDITFLATVSPNQVDCTTTIKNLHISEVVRLGVPEKPTVAGAQSWQDSAEAHLTDTQSLQAAIESSLPSFPGTLCSHSVGAENRSHETGSMEGSRTLQEALGAFQSHGESKGLPRYYEKKRLLGLHSGPEYSARITLTLQSTSKSNFNLTEVHCFLRPLVIWLDVRTLKRIESLIARSEDSAGICKRSAGAGVSRDGSRGARDDSDRGRLSHHFWSEENEASTASQRNSCPLNVYSPSVRVIVCFPLETQKLCSRTQKDFIGLDLSGPPNKNGGLQPLLVYRQVTEKKMSTSAGTGPSLLLRFGDIAANLILNNISEEESLITSDVIPFRVIEVLKVFDNDPIWGALPTLDRPHEQGISVEIHWDGVRKDGDWLARKTWDGIAAQQLQADGGQGIGGSNSEFAAATTAAEVVEEQNSQHRKELISSSSVVVRVNLPQVQLYISEPHYTRVLELMKCFSQSVLADSKDEVFGETGGLAGSRRLDGSIERFSDTGDSPQICMLLQCGRVDIDLFLPAQCSGLTSKHVAKPWDVVNVDIEKLQVLSVLGIDGVVETSYLWVHHEEGQVTGFYLEDDSTGVDGKSRVLLLSCKNKVLGRGDGGGGNALASGRAGLTLTYMLWPGQDPGQEQSGSALFTGTIRGSTFVAHGGRLDWLQNVSAFFNPAVNNEISEDACTDSASGGTAEYKSTDDQSLPSGTSNIFFLLDFQDAALVYEPGPEAMMVPGVRTERDPLRRVIGSSLDSSQMYAPVACVLAAAAVRVSSRAVVQSKGEQFDIWLRDVALHLLDTSLRKHLTSDYTTASMKRTGYVQIAKEAVMEALVRIDCEDGLQWEVECANSQLHFDTCHDTTAAFGRLVAQLQQLFAPEIDQTSLNGNNRTIDRRGSSAGSASTKINKLGFNGEMDGSVNDVPIEINLFDGVLEDAFSRVKSSPSFLVRDDDQKSNGAYSLLNVPIHSRVGSMDRYESVDSGRQDIFGAIKSSSSTPRMQSDLSEDSQASNNPVMFIEDYYMTLQKQGSFLGDRQSGESPRISGAPSRGSTSSGSGREVEGRGGWYAGKSLKVLENHVPQGTPRSDPDQQGACLRESQSPGKGPGLPKRYPSSVGRIVLSDLKAKWRLYGGSDWPTCRAYDQDLGIEENGRQSNVCMEVQLIGMRVHFDTFPAVGLYASRLVVTVRDVAVYDDSTDAPWKTVLSYNWSKERPRESSSHAVKFEMDAVRPVPTAPLEEYRLSIGLLPICLHLDQRHIEFFIQFFSQQPSGTADFTSTDEGIQSLSDSNSNLGSDMSSENQEITEEALFPFFQICEMRPFTIRVDYVPRWVDMGSLGKGNYVELLNLVSWKGIELNLKHVRATGVHGWSSLSGVMVGAWLEDISQNQVQNLVKGMSPIRPLYAVGTGAAKLVVLPVEHYKKDRRLFRGMRKGAMAFLGTLSIEVLGLGAHLAAGAHEMLQQAELAMGGTLSPCSYNTEHGERRSKALQPGDTREGIQQACESISRGLEKTASSLVGTPYKVYQRGGAGPAVASVIRAAPAAVVAPASAAAGAFHRFVLGLRNELDPDKKRESDEKHSGPPPDTGRTR